MATSTRLREISRDAAAKVAFIAAGTIGFSFLFVQAIVWNTPQEKEPYYRTLPGVDTSGLTPREVQLVLNRLNVQRCPCDCSRTVASCRNHHGSCSLSLLITRGAINSAHEKFRRF